MIARWIGPGFWALLALNAALVLVALAMGNLQAAANCVKCALAALACLIVWEWLR